MGKKVVYFILGGVAAAILYMVAIGIYVRISSDPIIFFASIVAALVISVVVGFGLRHLLKKTIDIFTIIVIDTTYFLGIMILAVFGPTFIDRSISYHIAFYAVDKGEVDIESIRDEFSEEIFDKRIHDAIVTGFIKESENSSDIYVPTGKAKLMNAVLKPIGKITGSLKTYEDMRGAVENEN